MSREVMRASVEISIRNLAHRLPQSGLYVALSNCVFFFRPRSAKANPSEERIVLNSRVIYKAAAGGRI